MKYLFIGASYAADARNLFVMSTERDFDTFEQAKQFFIEQPFLFDDKHKNGFKPMTFMTRQQFENELGEYYATTNS